MSDAPTRIPSPCTARFTTPSTAPGMPTEEQTCAALRGLVHGWQPVDMPSALPIASQHMDSELDGWRNFARDFSLAELRDKRILGWPTAANDVKDWPTIVALRDELTQMVRTPRANVELSADDGNRRSPSVTRALRIPCPGARITARVTSVCHAWCASRARTRGATRTSTAMERCGRRTRRRGPGSCAHVDTV